jgi:predicted GNAT family acetyltransferase
LATTVEHDAERKRYVIEVDGEAAGFSAYELGEEIVFTHTEIDPRFEGQGLGSRLVAGALDDVRRRGMAVLPVCPFVRRFIDSNREYVDLVPDRLRPAFGLADPASARE